AILVFIRDEIARPNLDDPHPHHAHDEHGHGHGHADTAAAAHAHAPITAAGEIDRAPAHAHAAEMPRVVTLPMEGHGLAAQAHAPAAAEHAGDRFVPFLWTLFMFILVTNLLGMLPFMGSPTASIWVTGGMALIAFVIFHAVPTAARGGPHKYLASIYPNIDL